MNITVNIPELAMRFPFVAFSLYMGVLWGCDWIKGGVNVNCEKFKGLTNVREALL